MQVLNIYSITHFLKNHKAMIREMKFQFEPIILTVNGQGALVIQTIDNYQHFVDFCCGERQKLHQTNIKE